MTKLTRILTVVTIALWPGVASAQPQAADGKGDRTRQNPPRPDVPHGGTTGTTVIGANGIDYNGGPVMLGTTKMYYIWYGNWSGSSATQILTDLANSIGGSPYFNINTTYYDSNNQSVSNSVSFGGSTTDNYSRGTALTDNDIYTIVAAHAGHDLPLDPNAVYFVLTSADVNETTGFCTSYCGWHTYNFINNVNIKYAFIGNGDRCPGSCYTQSPGPNGNSAADGMASVVSHELEESVTDPNLNAWYSGNYNENADKCAWNFGPTYSATNGQQANMHLGTRDYLIQQNWVNASGGYCAQSYATAPSFSLAGSVAQSLNHGQFGTPGYTVTVTPQLGFTGDVTLSVSGLPAGVTTAATPFSPNPVPGASGTSILSLVADGTTPAGSYSLTITGVSGTLTRTTTVTLNIADFTISATPTSRTVNVGSTTTYSVTVSSVGGFNSAVGLGVSGLPSGASAGFSPSITGSGTSTMTVNTGTAAAGTYSLSITGTSGALAHSTPVSLTLTQPDFTISATPTSRTVAYGGNTTYSVTIGAVGTFTSNVALSVSGLPSGASGTFSPTSITKSGTSTLTVNAGTAASGGPFSLSITGTSGALVHSFPVSLTINPPPPPDFSISASPTNPSVNQGKTVTSKITVAPLNGFSGVVSFSGASLPGGVTMSFSPTTVTGSGSTTATISAFATPAGTYSISVVGTSGSLTHSAALTLTVKLGGSLSLSAAPASLTLSRASNVNPTSTITLTSPDGFAGSVTLSASGLPKNVTASFSPATVTVTSGTPATSTMTISARNNASNGTTTFTVSGKSTNGPTGTVNVTLVITN